MTPELTVVVPTFRERENVPLLLAQLKTALAGIVWEAIFVDDDSPDGTPDVVAACARECGNVRLVHRIGRRGLSSACIEGMMASYAPVLAIMDADLQHDAAALPAMLSRLRQESLDIVVGTRNAEGGSMGEFGRARVLLSQLGERISHRVCKCQISDPMSGFFLMRRSFLMEVVHDLRGEGFKILVDMLGSAKRPVRIGEVGYSFRARHHGESKLNVAIGVEYVFMVMNKLLGDVIPVQLSMFLLVGSLGLVIHLVCLMFLVEERHVHFVTAQLSATLLAMSENFFLNNFMTFRHRRLTGRRIVPGMLRFVLACSFGAWANVVFARALWQSGVEWMLAGFAGILMGSVWNLSVSSFVTWPIRRPDTLGHTGDLARVVEVIR